jgi:hypothetical protein
VDVSKEKKCFKNREFKGSLKMWCHHGEEFKVKVKKSLNLWLVIAIPPVFLQDCFGAHQWFQMWSLGDAYVGNLSIMLLPWKGDYTFVLLTQIFSLAFSICTWIPLSTLSLKLVLFLLWLSPRYENLNLKKHFEKFDWFLVFETQTQKFWNPNMIP